MNECCGARGGGRHPPVRDRNARRTAGGGEPPGPDRPADTSADPAADPGDGAIPLLVWSAAVLVRESGCGKTTLGRTIIRLLYPTSGRIKFDGRDLGPLGERALRPMRRHLQMVFQGPYGSLNLRMIVEAMLNQALDIHRLFLGSANRRNRIAELLSDGGPGPAQGQRYPHGFSGGQRQLIGIARALSVEPRLVVCDELVSSPASRFRRKLSGGAASSLRTGTRAPFWAMPTILHVVKINRHCTLWCCGSLQPHSTRLSH